MARSSILLFAALYTIVLSGCATSHPVASLQAVEQNDFRLRLTKIESISTVESNERGTTRGVEIHFECRDQERGRIVAFSRGVHMDALKDECGHDLTPYFVLRKDRYGDPCDPATYGRWSDKGWVVDGRRNAVTTPTYPLMGLPKLPRRLRLIRGEVRALVSTKHSSHDFALEPCDWIELTPHLEFRIEQVESKLNSVVIQFEMRMPCVDADEELWSRRWYAVNYFDAEGKPAGNSRIAPHKIVDGVGYWGTEYSPGNKDKFPKRVCITIVEDFTVVRLPFEFRNVPLE